MKNLLLMLSFTLTTGIIQASEPTTNAALGYAALTGVLHGAGKTLHKYSKAPNVEYNYSAILASDLNIFNYPKYSTDCIKRQSASHTARAILTTSSVLHAPIRSAIGTLAITNILTSPLYACSFPYETSLKQITWSALKTPRYSLYSFITAVLLSDKYEEYKRNNRA